MCNCMNETIDKVKVQVIEQLPKHESLKVQWTGQMMRLDGGKNNVMLPIKISYRKLKNDDTPHRNETKTDSFMAMNYCPMCGDKYEAA